MPKTTHRLTAISASNIKKPGLFPDGSGLYLRVKPSGARSWAFRYMHDRKPRYLGLGSAASVNLHPTAIGQKVEIIVEHFRRHVMNDLGGQAKAMIVTQSREHALKYCFGVRDYTKQQGYHDLRALVAFSGELEMDGQTYTEAELNGFSETELPGRFDGFKPDGTPYPQQYHVLIVAEKYQTGFDQPKLCAMYIDRKLAGLQAVQTLSRLNRTRTSKERTHILDFQNNFEDIQTAFRPYYETSTLEAVTDPNQVYELEGRLFKFGLLDKLEIERFAETYYRGPLDATDRARLEGLVRQAIARFEAEDDEGRQEEFRQLLRSFMRFYGFVAQVIRLDDTGLEKLYSYASWLARLAIMHERGSIAMPRSPTTTADVRRWCSGSARPQASIPMS